MVKLCACSDNVPGSFIERLRWTQCFFIQVEMSVKHAEVNLPVLGDVLMMWVRKMAFWRCVGICPEDKWWIDWSGGA